MRPPLLGRRHKHGVYVTNFTEKESCLLMDSGSPDLKVLTAPQIYNMDLLNGGHVGGQPAFPGQSFNGGGSKITLEQVDPSTFDDESDDDEFTTGKGAKHGKKTRGRVKIKMEFIENKLRRYTTFSKRKTGIMKKVRRPFICGVVG